MFSMSNSTRPDSVYPSRCRLQRLFSPRSISMYESTLTSGRDELRLPRFKSSQSSKGYKCLSSPVSNLSTLGSLKARLSGAGVCPSTSPLPDRTETETCREREPELRTYASALRTRSSAAPVLTSYRMSESYLGRRPLSPSFLDLTPSPEYQPPEYNSPSEYSSGPGYPSPSKHPSPSAYYYSSRAICVSTTGTPPTKRIKRKPPPLILRDSFHATGSPSSTLAVPLIDANPAPLTPLTPFTPTSPRYRMPSEKEQLRRRLLKLQRTLGEQITPALVIRPKPNPETTAGPPENYKEKTTFIQCRQRTRTTLNTNSESDFFPTKSTLCAHIDRELLDPDSRFSRYLPVPFTHNRKSSVPVPSSPSLHSPNNYLLPETVTLTPMTLTAFVGSVTPRNATPTARSLEFVLNYDVQNSSSEDDEDEYPLVIPFDGDSCPPSPLQSDYACYSESGEEDIVLVDLPYLAPAQNEPSNMPGTPGVRRNEPRHGWSGEWNQAHIQDVIEKLRTL